MRKLSLFPVFFSLACSEHGVPTDGPADDASVQIVTSRPPYPLLELAETAAVRIGTVQGSSDYQFSRILFAAGLSDGRLVVVDAGSNDVRWYERDGSFLFRAGGRGEGPGELLGVSAGVLLAGDTLALFDARNQRLTWFGPEGALVRTRRLEATSAFDVALGDLGSGRILVVEHRATYNFGGSEFNYARDTLLLMIPSNTSEVVDTISRLPGREAITWVDYVDGRPVGTRQMDLPFGETALARGVREGVVVAGPGGSEISFHSIDGTLVRSARRTDVQLVEASSDLQERYVDSAVEKVAAEGRPTTMIREFLEGSLALLPEGRAVPAFDRILVEGSYHQIWMREFVAPWMKGEASRWTVYDRDGRVEAQVDVPAGFRPMHVYRNQIVGVETDELGVEYVAVYSLS